VQDEVDQEESEQNVRLIAVMHEDGFLLGHWRLFVLVLCALG